jgi:pimeloyl-ACP methyl ester carboxylesterase
MTLSIKTLFLAGTVIMGASAMAALQSSAATTHPTIVLEHRTFPDAPSWGGVISRLQNQGYTAIATANLMRNLKVDSNQLVCLLKGIKGPVVHVGRSNEGASVINAAIGNNNVEAMVYVVALTPVLDEAAADLSQKEAQLMSATQRSATAAALNEKSLAPAWKTIPSWFIFGTLDKNIPTVALEFKVKWPGAKEVVKVKGASHVVMVSSPDAVVKQIEKAAEAK